MNNPQAVVSLSGGMDSATVLVDSLHRFGETLAIGFTYGSKHNQYEQKAAFAVASYYKVRYIPVELSTVGILLKSDLLLSGGEIPEGHYESENMKKTVVPGRNMIFISILAAIAESFGARYVCLGIHSGDHAIYPDCRPEFFHHARNAIRCSTEEKVDLFAPFIGGDKKTILEYGFSQGLPYELTRTCYKDQPLACGKCGACQERLEAFAFHGVKDPVLYA